MPSRTALPPVPARADGPARRPVPRRTRVVAGAALGLGLALSAPLAASAHVELDASSTAPAALSVLTFAVGHGCEGSATTALAIRFPADVQAVKPTLAPGWSVAEQEAADGTTVTYTADTPLPDALRATVQVEALLPVDGAAGDVVAFPTLQTCVEGSTDWAETPAAGAEPDHPAPDRHAHRRCEPPARAPDPPPAPPPPRPRPPPPRPSTRSRASSASAAWSSASASSP
ncbi:YcnI family protein [Clavibacter zhangzhiyongii]|uniref:YcnI family protein n=1 Tax=Clavibacter zhangzhiyongii TaxID=2768071 RepID=UPI0039DF7761